MLFVMTLFCTMSFNWDLFGLNPNLQILDMHSVCSFQTSLSNVGGLSSPTIDLFTFFILIHVLSVPLAMPYFFCCCSYSWHWSIFDFLKGFLHLFFSSLVDSSYFPLLFQLPHIFGNWCLHPWHDHTTADDFELSCPQSSQQHPPYHKEQQSIPYQPVSPTYHPDHTMLYSTPPHLLHNSKFPCFTTAQQNWSNTMLISLPLLLQR